MPLPSTQDSFEILGKFVKLATFHGFLMILIREIKQIGDSSSLSKVCVCQDYGKQMFGIEVVVVPTHEDEVRECV